MTRPNTCARRSTGRASHAGSAFARFAISTRSSIVFRMRCRSANPEADQSSRAFAFRGKRTSASVPRKSLADSPRPAHKPAVEEHVIRNDGVGGRCIGVRNRTQSFRLIARRNLLGTGDLRNATALPRITQRLPWTPQPSVSRRQTNATSRRGSRTVSERSPPAETRRTIFLRRTLEPIPSKNRYAEIRFIAWPGRGEGMAGSFGKIGGEVASLRRLATARRDASARAAVVRRQAEIEPPFKIKARTPRARHRPATSPGDAGSL